MGSDRMGRRQEREVRLGHQGLHLQRVRPASLVRRAVQGLLRSRVCEVLRPAPTPRAAVETAALEGAPASGRRGAGPVGRSVSPVHAGATRCQGRLPRATGRQSRQPLWVVQSLCWEELGRWKDLGEQGAAPSLRGKWPACTRLGEGGGSPLQVPSSWALPSPPPRVSPSLPRKTRNNSRSSPKLRNPGVWRGDGERRVGESDPLVF